VVVAVAQPVDTVYGFVDILELKDRIVQLYDHAQLDGENSELDALKRLASSHDNTAPVLHNTRETVPFSTQLSTRKLSSENLSTANSLETTTISTSTEPRVNVERSPSEHPMFAKREKLLLIPDAATKRHSVTGQNHSQVTQRDGHGGWKSEQTGSGCSTTGPTKRRNVSDGGQKSVPLGDVMNVKLMAGHMSPRGAVSLVPLSSVALAPRTQSPVKLDWNRHVKIKQEPGLSCQRAGKRKMPEEHGMFN